MLENFLYSVNTVAPIFVMVLLGWLLKRLKFLSDSFFADSEKFVFKIALPCMLFLEVADSGGSQALDFRLIGFCCAGIALSVVALMIFVPIFVKDNDKRGAIIQGSYRSNFAVLGVPLAESMFGSDGSAKIAMLMPFVIILFNVFAVIILSVFAPADKKQPLGKIVRDVLLSIVKNPLIIAVALAVPFMLFGIQLPTFLNKSVTYLSNTVFALALMSLGAGFTVSSLKGRLGYALAATVIKTVVLPVTAILVAMSLGFGGVEVGLVFVLFGSPSAISSFIMAKNMGSDHELAGQILLMTTLVCLLTIFLGIFIMKTFSII